MKSQKWLAMKGYQNWEELTNTDKCVIFIEMKNIILKQTSQYGGNNLLDPIEDLVEERIRELEDKYEVITNNSVQTRTQKS